MEKSFELRAGVDFASWTSPDVNVYKVNVKDLKLEDVKPTFEAFFKWEESLKFPKDGSEVVEAPRVDLRIKRLPYDVRREILRTAILYENCLDANLILNIYNLIKKYNSFSDDFFSSESIFVNSAEEFMDFVEDLHTELGTFRKNLILWLISVIRSCGITESFSEKPVVIPFAYQMVLFMTDFISLSNMMKNEREIPGKLHIVGNADNIILSLSKKCVTMYDLMEKIGG